MHISDMVLTLAGIFTATGFWELLRYLLEKRSNKTRLLIGLAHHQLLITCENYIDRGHITADEYDDLYTYLYEPYSALGGNGSIERIMDEIKALPSRKEEIQWKIK